MPPESDDAIDRQLREIARLHERDAAAADRITIGASTVFFYLVLVAASALSADWPLLGSVPFAAFTAVAMSHVLETGLETAGRTFVRNRTLPAFRTSFPVPTPGSPPHVLEDLQSAMRRLHRFESDERGDSDGDHLPWSGLLSVLRACPTYSRFVVTDEQTIGEAIAKTSNPEFETPRAERLGDASAEESDRDGRIEADESVRRSPASGAVPLELPHHDSDTSRVPDRSAPHGPQGPSAVDRPESLDPPGPPEGPPASDEAGSTDSGDSSASIADLDERLWRVARIAASPPASNDTAIETAIELTLNLVGGSLAVLGTKLISNAWLGGLAGLVGGVIAYGILDLVVRRVIDRRRRRRVSSAFHAEFMAPSANSAAQRFEILDAAMDRLLELHEQPRSSPSLRDSAAYDAVRATKPFSQLMSILSHDPDWRWYGSGPSGRPRTRERAEPSPTEVPLEPPPPREHQEKSSMIPLELPSRTPADPPHDARPHASSPDGRRPSSSG